MATSKELSFTRKNSAHMLDKAEDLVDRLEDLSYILTAIEGKYLEGGATSDELEVDELEFDDKNLSDKLVDSIESTKILINYLRKEKRILGRREMSVDMRMVELEDYKSHIKRDVTSMNETLDMLSIRVIQLENSLCEADEKQDELTATNTDLTGKVEQLRKENKELLACKDKATDDMKDVVKTQKRVQLLMKEKELLRLQLSTLHEENHSLKEMIRKDLEFKLDQCSISSKDSGDSSFLCDCLNSTENDDTDNNNVNAI